MKLKDICEFIIDCPHSTAKDEGEGYPLIRTPNIGKGRLLLEEVHRVSADVYKNRTARGTPQDDDLILAREAPIGNVAIIKNGIKVCLGQRTVLIRPDKNRANPDFLVYYLLSPEQQGKLKGYSNGATVNHLNMVNIRSLDINIPNIKVQNRIASILSAYDDLIENNQKQIKLLEEAAQRLYKEWFVDLRFPGHEDVEFVDGLPKGWEEVSINEMIDILSGYAFKSSDFTDVGNYKIVTIKNVLDGVFNGDDTNNIVTIPESMPLHCMLNDGDILLSLTGNVGRVCLVYGENYLLNQRVAKLESKYKAYCYCLFRSRDMFYEMNNLANGAAQQNLSPIRTGEIKIKKPNALVLDEFEKKTQPLLQSIITLGKQNEMLVEAHERLLPKLMSGEVEV